jgi:hypothetical protein
MPNDNPTCLHTTLSDHELYGAVVALQHAWRLSDYNCCLTLAAKALAELGYSEGYLTERLAEWEAQAKRAGVTDEDLEDPKKNPLRFTLMEMLRHPAFRANEYQVNIPE